nr:hypothetical protein CFP56_62274 [Quercus suber]
MMKRKTILASDVNSVQNQYNGRRERVTLGKHDTSKYHKRLTDALSVKYRKLKPTNPKPFRLRTDERGILKEANSETKLAPLKEITTDPRPLVRNSERILKNKN